MDTVRRIALVLVIIGALNWGLIGFFQFDLVATIFGGQASALSRIVYALVGLSGLFSLGMLFSPMINEDSTIMDTTQTERLEYGTEFGDETSLMNEQNPNELHDLDEHNRIE